MYLYSFEPNKWGVGWNQPFSLNPHLLEYRVVEDISGAPIVYEDSMSVVVPYTYANHKCIILRVVETLCIFFCESDHGVVNPCHLCDEPHQLDVLNHSKVVFACLLGRIGSGVAPYNHPYVS